MTRFRAQRKRLALPGDVGTLKQTVQLLWQVAITNTIIASMLVLSFFFNKASCLWTGSPGPF